MAAIRCAWSPSVAGLVRVIVGAAITLAGCASNSAEPGASAGDTGSGASNENGGNTGTARGGAAGVGGSGTGGGAGSAQAGATSRAPIALESVARRLSRSEIDHVLADVLGDTTNAASAMLVEDDYSPYDNDYTLQSASQALIDGLAALAEDVAKRALSDTKRRAALVPCTPTGAGDSACFRSTIQALGKRLFRRPLSAEEVDDYATLLSFATENNPSVNPDFYTGVELFLRSVLQDPEFLYRIEVGTARADGALALDSYEIASRVSFLIVGSTPDDALLTAADEGALTDPGARRAQALRLLNSDAAREQLHRYHAMWLGYRAIPQPAALVREFDAETTALIDRVVFEERRPYLDLFTMPETYLDASLADHYGLPRPSGSAGWVAYGSSGRAGILSHGSVLSAFSKFSDTSPTQRGILVRTRLLCEDVPPPPPNVNVDQPPGTNPSACKVDRYAEHRASPSCASCHDRLDPIGLGLERFDMAGRYREHDDGAPSCVIDGRGELPGYGTFSGPAELAERLIASQVLDACSLRQYLTFALGRRPNEDEQALLDDKLARFRADADDFANFIADFVESPEFALRREPAP